MTSAEYLAWEATQFERHEFVNGEVFTTAGAEDRHVTVVLNVAMALREHLSGTPCRTFVTDMKLHVAAANSYFRARNRHQLRGGLIFTDCTT